MNRPTFDSFDEDWANLVVGQVSRKGIDSYLGLKVTEITAGRLVCEMPVTDELITAMGSMHGGCLSAMCDHVLGVVMYPVMAPGSWAATTEFKINLLAPVKGGICIATSEIISMSKRLAVVRIEIENDGRLVAAAQGTCTIVAPKK
ncbi:MAG: PaaI family thioesterase [Actinomycetia bacterium]|nr:PaaI family thioesterase [Actinomycetes bacterium]MCP4959844.1 PaaI family thioesterase [Actinomycetes bacterium]